MKKTNPFTPNNPVSTGMFAGRLKEIKILEQSLHQTKNGNPSNILVTGERGIGKSSLMMIFKYFASGKCDTLEHGNFKFLTIDTVISNSIGLVSFINLIENCIRRELGNAEEMRAFLSDTWDFMKRIKVMDSGISDCKTISDPDLIIDGFAYSLAQICKRITNHQRGESRRDGILFIIDEADNANESLKIGYFFKCVTELLQKHYCFNVMFVVVGLPEITDKLRQSHKSSLRVFNEIKIKELNSIERKKVIDMGLKHANKINEEKTTIAENAKEHISRLSDGYPHFIQQFSYSAFDVNSDGEISIEDVMHGAYRKNGAIDLIGTKYYEEDYNLKIQSDKYREVLSIMANDLDDWIKKSDIRMKFSGSDTTLTDALVALTSRKIILKKSSARGEYRLQQKGFAIWIKLFGEQQKKEK